jgi:N-acyl-D-amino-acid deacylase
MTHSRREFLGTTAAGLAVLSGAPFVPRRREHDIVIRGGWLHDGAGSRGEIGDLAITGDRISAMAPRIVERGRTEIEAAGLAVMPGFIDIHSHGNGSLRQDPRAESCIRQGITTIVVGADGGSSDDLGAYFDSIDALRPGVNVASMIGLGTVRGDVVGAGNREATAAEVDRMTAMVDAALAAGACGASSGLEYTPGGFARPDELARVCRPLAARGLPYATHMRNEDDRVLEAIDESIAIARGAGCPLHISHLKMQGPRNWPRLDEAFARIAAANREGISTTFDRYPYVAYATSLTSLFPIWSREGGTPGLMRLVDGGESGARVRTEVLAKVELIGGWDNVQVTSVREPADRGVEGKRVGSYATALGEDPYRFTVELIRRNGSVGMVGFAMSEENLDRIFAHPLSMVCSDGGAFAVDGPTRRGTPHPRGIGSFPRVLGRYVRDRSALTLEQAVHKMSGFPATRCRLAHRGHLVAGGWADVVVVDPSTVADRATFEDPFQYPVGIRTVIVNGGLALHEERRHEGTGRAVRADRG